jgi:uncharacterized protein YcnI
MHARRTVVAALVVIATVVALAEVADAHVTLYPSSLPKGASDVLVGFAVPNESTTNADVVQLEIDLPTANPILGAHAQAIPGWTVAVVTTQLAKPVTTDDGQITEAVSKITWTAATPAAGFGPDQFMLFNVLAGTLPSNTSTLVFKALQTYSDGTVVSWIEPIVKGTPAPEHPTPILKLTKKAKGS